MAWARRQPVAAVILVICVIIEAVLEGAGAGLWGNPYWRGIAFAYGAFRGDLIAGAPALYPLQKLVMFLSYGFLHGGFLHVTLNMLTLVSLAAPVAVRIGQRRFLALYLLATIGGGIGFALLTPTPEPMIGASGALFGLAGAVLSWAWTDRRAYGWGRAATARLLARPMLYLVLLNIGLYWATGGGLAWGAHLGGFVVGWVMALTWGRIRPGFRFAGR